MCVELSVAERGGEIGDGDEIMIPMRGQARSHSIRGRVGRLVG